MPCEVIKYTITQVSELGQPVEMKKVQRQVRVAMGGPCKGHGAHQIYRLEGKRR